MRKFTIEYCRSIAAEKDGECLSIEYIGVRSKLQWRCENGHIWLTALDNVKNRNAWCPECHRIKLSLSKILKNGINIAKEIAKNNNGECLSTVYKSAKDKLIWECHLGHIWKIGLTKIKDDKSWCPYCAGNVKFSIEDAKKVAEENNGKCLSEEYVNCDNPLTWECRLGHTWESSLYLVKNRFQWCPLCSCTTSRNQRKLTKICKNIFNDFDILSNYRGFSWLKSDKNYRQEIDIWVPDLKLAIEYDGQQHFMPVSFGGISKEKAKANFERTKYLDKMKNDSINSHKKDVKYFIRFNYKDDITIESIKKKLTSYNIPIGE